MPIRAKGRKATPNTKLETLALVRAMQEQCAVLLAWHPHSIPLAITAQQLSAMRADLDRQE